MTGPLRPGGRTVQHPARYSPEVLDLLRFVIPRLTRVHDPFAGTGERLGRTADDRPWFFTGTEIEAVFIVDPRVSEGDSTELDTYPWPVACGTCGDTAEVPSVPCSAHVLRRFTIVTSPVYPNGMADDFVSRETSERKTYRHAKAAILGDPAAKLLDRNMGRWGYRSTANLSNPARMMYWHLAERAVACWGDAERALVNVSDFLAGDRRVPVVDPWCRLLERNGWTIEAVHEVRTRRMRNGANAAARVEAEHVIDAYRTAA